MTEDLCSDVLSLSIAVCPDEQQVVVSRESLQVGHHGLVVL